MVCASHPLPTLCSGAAGGTHPLHSIYWPATNSNRRVWWQHRGLWSVSSLHKGGTWTMDT